MKLTDWVLSYLAKHSTLTIKGRAISASPAIKKDLLQKAFRQVWAEIKLNHTR